MDRFWSKVDIRGPDECWPWSGARSLSGYGQFAPITHGPDRRQTGAHRVAWELTAEEPAPSGYFVCHRCDNPPCCNPRHLFLGTPRQNTADMIAKGRRVVPSVANRARGDRHPSRTQPEKLVRGEAHHAARLTADQVRIIRESVECGVSVARKFGVAPITISRIRRRLIWKHVA